ncbi:hypothetical protein BH10PSE13_BH10PSE13_03150 [soil metagenome]
MTASKSGSELISARRRIAGISRRVWLSGIGTALVAALISMALGDMMSRPLFDWWQRLSPRDLSASDVRVVLVDAESLAELGPWPWPRYHLARLTEEIASHRPAAIGFDMMFPEPDRIRPDIFAAFYPELSAVAGREVRALQPMDRVFGSVIGRAPVVLSRVAVPHDGADPTSLLVDATIEGPLPPALPFAPRVIANISELEGAALGHGLLNGPPDEGGVVRRVPVLMRVGERAMPGLASELARVASGQERITVAAGRIEIGTRRVPVDTAGRMALRFGVVPPAHISSAVDVLRRHFPANAFAGKIVLVGLAAEGTADVVATPMSSTAYGTLVQAQAIDAIRRGGWLVRPAWGPFAEWGCGILLALAVLLCIPRRRRALLLVPVGGAAMVAVGAWLAFDFASLLLDPFRPLLVGTGAVVGTLAGIFAEARRDRERLRDTLVRERIATAATEGELQAARSIQLGMLPPRETLATLDTRLDIDALLEPAKSVGGDFFDVVRLSDDLIFFTVADVTGKGVPAALFMALAKALTKSVFLRKGDVIGEAALLLNEELSRDNGEAMGVTMLLGVLDLASGRVMLVSAGHEHPFLMRDGRAEEHRLDGGPPFCLMEFPYPAEPLQLAPGEGLILITDGVTEAQNGKGALFGAAAARGAVAMRSDDSATAMVEALRGAVRTFEAGTEPTDDLTVMALRWRGPGDGQSL